MHLAKQSTRPFSSTQLIEDADVLPVRAGLVVWDAWPIQSVDGGPLTVARDMELWMALGAPRSDDPDARHGCARIHLLLRHGQRWRDLGPAMPDGFSPGSREWSGTAVIDPDGKALTLYFTAAGRRDENSLTFEQRIFAANAFLEHDQEAWCLSGWGALREILPIDPALYMPTTGGGGAVGTIKAFRDPAFFRDPADGQNYLLFAGSRANSASNYNGVVGIARARPGVAAGWELLEPIVSADCLNNELERPHVIVHGGLYYLFWSTQRHVFDPSGPTGPTGLYGMVSSRLTQGWEPLNGTGLVFANPEAAPAQAYSWWVLPDLSVTSFVDDWGGGDARRFGGAFAPFVRLGLDGARAWLEGQT
ncbi:MAG TPA: glycoside hydrolase family 68 protein [Caulobacter sp.]|nr:glycoside hydrolase family 68 protein [Caulobacter sp.]